MFSLHSRPSNPPLARRLKKWNTLKKNGGDYSSWFNFYWAKYPPHRPICVNRRLGWEKLRKRARDGGKGKEKGRRGAFQWCGKIGQVTIWPNGKFHSGIAFTVHRISSIYRNTVAPKSETVLKDGFEQMEQEFPFGPCRPAQPDFLSCTKFRCYRKFYIGTTRKLVVHLHLNRNFWNLLENEKRPRFHPQAFPCIVRPAVRWSLWLFDFNSSENQ